MSDEKTTTSSEPSGENYSEALLQTAIERLKVRGDSSSRFACMQLPPPIFNDLCARLCSRAQNVKETAQWLAGQVPDAPTRSSVERFSTVLFEEYRLAQYSQRRSLAKAYVRGQTEGDRDAQIMALNDCWVELISDELMQVPALNTLDEKRVFALSAATKAAAAISFDKQKMDARIAALTKLNEHRQVTIDLLEQKLAAVPTRIAAIEKKVAAVAG